MFDHLIKELQLLAGINKISIEVAPDQDGFIDKECPSKECLFNFKMHGVDLLRINNEGTQLNCPMCGYAANFNSWYTSEQLMIAAKQGVNYAKTRIFQALRKDVTSFNKAQKKDVLISMKLDLTGKIGNEFIVPIKAKEEMQRKVTCKECGLRYAVIGSAFFCPGCGHNSAEETLTNSLSTIYNILKNLPTIKKTVAQFDKDQAENTHRSLIEKCLLDCIVAFQRFCEVKYKALAPTTKVPFNAFQKIDVGGELWKQLIGLSYTDWLTEMQFERFNILFQRRHLLQHTDGITDQKYIDKTKDPAYQVGQRIVIKEADVSELLYYVDVLTSSLQKAIRSKNSAP